MGNFIDKTFTVIADILLKVIPASKQQKLAFSYYRDGLAAQEQGKYAEALENYYEALQLEEDRIDRSYIVYNIAYMSGSMGEDSKALEFYHQALRLNPKMSQALNNIACIYHASGVKLLEYPDQQFQIDDVQSAETRALATEFFDEAGTYWRQALIIAPNNYPVARNWLKMTGRLYQDNYTQTLTI